MNTLTQKQLKELLVYDPATGVFTWRVSRRACTAGSIAGSDKDGYRRIGISNHMYHAHRLAWLYTHGAWPEQQIDHINGIGSDNRIENLREASPSENMQNRRGNTNNSSGYAGVTRSRGGWQAQIMSGGVSYFLGRFNDPEAAHAEYLAAKAKLHKLQPVPRK